MNKAAHRGLWPLETSPEVQNRGISGPTKRTYVLQLFFLKKSILQLLSTFYDNFYQCIAHMNQIQLGNTTRANRCAKINRKAFLLLSER